MAGAADPPGDKTISILEMFMAKLAANFVAIMAAALMLAGALLAGVLTMLWGGYLVLVPELGAGVAALTVGAVPLLATMVAVVAMAFRARRPTATNRAMLGELFEQGGDWARAHPMESVTLAFLAGTTLGASAEVRDGIALSLAK